MRIFLLSFFSFTSLILFLASCNMAESREEQEAASAPDEGEVRLILDAQAQLGEGAFWNYKSETLFWVDIEGQSLHIYDPAQHTDRKIPMGQRIGTVVPTEDGNAVVALEDGVYLLDLETEALRQIASPEAHLSDIRFNDGKCDPAGRLWVGSMHLQQIPYAASLYRIEADGQSSQMLDSVTISNGINWSLDHKTMYYIDTYTQKVRAFDYDIETGDISNSRVVIEVPKDLGFPDGMTIDAEGMLWIALWNGNKVSRWDPADGSLISTLEVPAHNITSVAFGGPELDELYITSASIDMSEDESSALPSSGGLFRVKPGVKGVPCAFFGTQPK